MKVTWEMPGWEVRWFAAAGQQTMGWMSWVEWPHEERAARAIEVVYERDQAVCSEALMTRAEPVNKVEIMGERTLWMG